MVKAVFCIMNCICWNLALRCELLHYASRNLLVVVGRALAHRSRMVGRTPPYYRSLPYYHVREQNSTDFRCACPIVNREIGKELLISLDVGLLFSNSATFKKSAGSPPGVGVESDSYDGLILS